MENAKFFVHWGLQLGRTANYGKKGNQAVTYSKAEKRKCSQGSWKHALRLQKGRLANTFAGQTFLFG